MILPTILKHVVEKVRRLARINRSLPSKQHLQEFNEAWYLRAYPDVANAVKAKIFQSGLDHYTSHGFSEGRLGCPDSTPPARKRRGVARLRRQRPAKLDSLPHAIAAALQEVQAATGNARTVATFRARIRQPLKVGPLIAAQHLRNLLLAYSDMRLFRRMEKIPGLKGATAKSHFSKISATLDQALIRHCQEAFAGSQEPSRPPRRVLIVIDHMPGMKWMGAHARQVCCYSSALALLPEIEAVRVLVTQETAPENPYFAGGEIGQEEIDGWNAVVADLAGDAAAKVDFVTPAREGAVRPYQLSLELANAFRPDAVIAFQGMYLSRVVAPIVGATIPALAIQFNQYNPEPAYADLVLAHSFRASFSTMPTPAKWRNHPIPLIPFPRHTTIDTKDIAPDATIRIVTALTLGRLEKGLLADELTSLKLVAEFLTPRPHVAWLFIGIAEPEEFRKTVLEKMPELAAFGDRLCFMRPVSDLRAVYAHCAAYVHLPILHGGAMGIAMAVAECVPALVKVGTDSANFIDRDLIYHDTETCFSRLAVWVDDPVLRQRVNRRQKERIEDKHSLAATGALLMDFLTSVPSAAKPRSAPVQPATKQRLESDVKVEATV